MDRIQAKERIEKLTDYVAELQYNYYVLDNPKVTDAQYDTLLRELIELEKQFPEYVLPNSPTQKVGGEPVKSFSNVTHRVPMLSLQDAFNKEELLAWQARMGRLVSGRELDESGYYCEIKMDGLAVSLVYENGELKYAATRGNGRVGEVITENVKTIKSIPIRLRKSSKYYNEAKERVEIRGEVFMPVASFAALNTERSSRGEATFANPRNAAAGSLRQLDSKITASRNLDFNAYGLVGLDTTTHEEEHVVAIDLGLPSNKYNKYIKTLDEVDALWQEWGAKRGELPYQIDGMVINVNSRPLFEKLGVAGRAPRGAIAYKWPAEEVTTIVENIDVQVGRTGTLTPVAYLRPVEVAGSTVSRATLHNEDEIRKKDIKIGDSVVVRKAGDVIPEVVGPLKELRTGREKDFVMPNKCPRCGGPVERKNGEAAYRCLNPNCFAVQFRYIQYFVSKPAFDIDGLGPKIIEQLINEGLIETAADLFTLKVGDLQPLERFADKSAQNIITAIQNAKEIELPRFIYALGIRNVGEETAIDLAAKYWKLDRLMAASKEEINQIHDIGDVVAGSIYDYFHNQKNIDFIKKLEENGVRIKEMPRVQEKTGVAGKTFVFTGGMETMTRNAAKELVRKYGGNISESVGKNVDIVVAGDEAGSKLEKAQKLGVKIIDEKTFLDLIK